MPLEKKGSVGNLEGQKQKAICLLLLLTLMVSWLGFTTIRYSIAQPLCCGDDGAIALVAKSLSEGDGYALPINFSGESGRFLFDPGISTGPTLIVPAAIMMRIFGYSPWIPGFTSAILSLGLLCWASCLAMRRFGLTSGAVYVISALVFIYFVTSGQNFIHWHALVGEIPAALLTLCAVFFVVADGAKISERLSSGLILGLAVQAKLLASLAFPGLAILSLWGASGWARKKNDWIALAAFVAGFLLPILAFELWRVYELGLHGYVAWIIQLHDFVQSQVPGANSGADGLPAVLTRSSANSQIAMNTYGHAPLDLTAGMILLSLAALKFSQRIVGKFAVCVMLIAVSHLMWWLLFSNGWQRYELIGMILTSCMLATVGLWTIEAKFKVLAGFAAVAFALPISNPRQLTWFLAGPKTLNSPREKNLRDALQPILHTRASSILVGGWWASLVEPKFLLPDNVHIVGFNRLSSLSKKKNAIYLIINNKWDNFAGLKKDPSYMSFVAKCQDLLVKNEDFELYKCPNLVSP